MPGIFISISLIYKSGKFSLSLLYIHDFSNVEIYKLSTFSLAHGVRRKNFNEDFIDGSTLKQLISIRCAMSSQP
jgi:hypothetical protein